jgi:acetate kinase
VTTADRTADVAQPSGADRHGRVTVLVVNAGSSSLKLRLLDGDEVIERADLPALTTASGTAAVRDAIAGWPVPDVIGHRIVHGGTTYTGPVRVDADVRRELESFTALAPLHQPASLAALAAVTDVFPAITSVACFDTAFHATIAAEVSTYPIPRAWREGHGIRRYGFHGLSHAYAARRAAEVVQRPLAELRVVTCHLGAGASLAAVAGGRSVDTTMGFTPLDGLVMATRSGAIDPGVVLWLQDHGWSARAVEHALEHESGLAAFHPSGDMRLVEAAASDGDADARLAIAVYVHRLVGYVASMTATLGGIDVLAFTGGVGENSRGVRSRTAARLGFLGLAIDAERNARAVGDAEISAIGSAVRTVVVAAREDLEIARLVAAFAEPPPSPG